MEHATFGPYRLDLKQQMLWRGLEPVALGSRALDLLCSLVRAEGRVLTKDELLAKVWPGVLVEENTLQVHVSALRKALAHGGNQPWLVTVPGRGYRFQGADDAGPTQTASDKPSIAVLAFANQSGDPAQEYFADGISEDIIVALTRFRWFHVIGRNSSFTYKGRPVAARQVARELGARYVLEGSVRRSGTRMRISALLVDAATETQLWAERYERELADMFVVQDEIAHRVCGAIEPELLLAEGERRVVAGEDALGVWDLIRRGIWHFHQLGAASHGRALASFREAARRAPGSSEAQMWVSRAATGMVAYGWCGEPQKLLRESLAAATLATRLQPRDPYCHFALAMAQVFSGQFVAAARAAEAAVDISPSFALGHLGLGMALLYGGRAADAVGPLQRGLRLNPADPQNSHWYRLLALALLFCDREQEALVAAHDALKARPDWPLTLQTAAACHAALGQQVEAQYCLAQLRGLPTVPGDPVEVMRKAQPAWEAQLRAYLDQAAAQSRTSTRNRTPG